MDLDSKIFEIQRSTRTLFNCFTPLHNWIRLKARFYYIWSLKPYSVAVHWVILGLYLVSLPAILLLNFSTGGTTINNTHAEGPYDYPHWELAGGDTFSGKTIVDIIAVSTDIIWARTSDSLYKSTNSGDTWSEKSLPANTFDFVSADASTAWALVFTDGILSLHKTIDGAISWSDFTDLGLDLSEITDMVISSTGTVWIYGTREDRVHVNVNKITSAGVVSHFDPQLGDSSYYLMQLNVANAYGNDSIWLAGTQEVHGTHGYICHTSNADITAYNLPDENLDAWSCWYDETQSAIGTMPSILATGDGSAIASDEGMGIFKTINNNLSWSRFIGFPVYSDPVRSMTFTTDTQDNKTIWAATGNTISRLSIDELSWYAQAQGLLSANPVNYYSLKMTSASDDSKVFVWAKGYASNGSKIFRYSSLADATATKYTIVFPGQTYDKNTGVVTGTLAPIRAGEEVPITVYSTDNNGVLDTRNASWAAFSTSDTTDTDPDSIQLTNNNQCSQSVPVSELPCGTGTAIAIFHKSGPSTVTVSDPNGVLLSSTSSSVTVTAGDPISTYFPSSAPAVTAGVASSAITLGFKDQFANAASTTSATSVHLSSSAATGKFASSQAGQWYAPLDLAVASGQSSPTFYYLDYTADAATITASWGLTEASLGVAVAVNSTVNLDTSGISLSTSSLLVGGTATITASLMNNLSEPLANKTIQFFSDRSEDSITNPVSQTGSDGKTAGSITSSKAGQATVSAFDVTDGVWLRYYAVINFINPTPQPDSGIDGAGEASPPSPTLELSISSDKNKLVLGNDVAKITVNLVDSIGNYLIGEPVSLSYLAKFGDLDNQSVLTDNKGLAVFVFTPKTKGMVDISPVLSGIVISNKKITLEIVENSLIGQLSTALQNSVVAKNIAEVVSPIVPITASLGLIPLLASAIGNAPILFHGVAYGASLLLEFAGIRKRRKRWGRVYDSTTGKGIQSAIVELYNQETLELVGRVETDAQGRYNFQPKPGTYVISLLKKGYIYPTQIFAEYGISKARNNASNNNSQYLGQPIIITGGNDLLNLDIPIDPVGKKATLGLKIKIFTGDLLNIITSSLAYIFIPALIVGTILSIFVELVVPNTKNAILAIVYLVITLVYITSKIVKSSHFSTIIDISTKKPIPDVFILFFDAETDTLVESRKADKYGRFSIYAQPGKYYIRVDKVGYKFDFKAPEDRDRAISKQKKRFYYGESITLKSAGFIKANIAGRRERNSK